MIRIAAATILLATWSFAASGPDPLNGRESAMKLIANEGLEGARKAIDQMMSANPPVSSPYQLSYLAELMKLTGDPRAPSVYRNAVGKDPQEPAIDLLFGEYMRNFRGPMQPMMGAAEKHFFETARKLACLGVVGASGRDTSVHDQLKRSIVSLYERDGLPVYSWITGPTGCAAKSPGVSIFFSTGVRGGEGIADLDIDSDVRDLTSAAAYSQSLRLGLGPLSTGLLRSFLRTDTPFENLNRLRTRYKGGRLDLLFSDRRTGNAAITYPDLRDRTFLTNRDLVTYNSLKLNDFGVSAGATFQLFPATDADLAVTYSKLRRTGLIDGLPTALENINQVEVKAVVSRFVGPDKVNGEFTFVDQSISPEQTPFQNRGRQIYAGTFRYQIYRLGSGGYSRAFRGTRGLEFYTGATRDHENFGYDQPALVDRHDYFAGATVRALHFLPRLVDLSIQPTWFTFTVPKDASRNSRQYRTAAYALVRLVDEERVGPNLPSDWHGWRLGFVHLIIPFQHDVPQQGLSAFSNQKVGAEMAAKWFTTARGGTTFLGSARYDVQQFNQLNRTFSVFTLNISMGF